MNRRFITGLSIMEKAMLTGDEMTYKERVFLKRAAKQMSKYGHNKEGQGKDDWPLKRLPAIKYSLPLKTDQYIGWGWKEPNTHLALEAFEQYFPNLKYIHTVRHGLDMAYSGNQQQLHNWGRLFNIDIPKNAADEPVASFKYWAAANRRAVEIGKRLGKDKFLMVNFDKLCREPKEGVKEIADFLGINATPELLEAAAKLPVSPETIGRYKDHPEHAHDPADLAFLKELGFDY
jgi:hypothetical protein